MDDHIGKVQQHPAAVPEALLVVELAAGLLYGLAGFLECARTGGATSAYGLNYEFDAIASCVVGGVSMTGGVGKPWGVVIGCLLITVIANGLDIMGVSSHWQKIVKGAIIVLAVLIDVKGKSKKR